jgi:hypothetical protein
VHCRDIDPPDEGVGRIVQHGLDVPAVEVGEAAADDPCGGPRGPDPLGGERRPARVVGRGAPEGARVVGLVPELPVADVPRTAHHLRDHVAPGALAPPRRRAPAELLERDAGAVGDEPRGLGDHPEHPHAVRRREGVDTVDRGEVRLAPPEHEADREVHPQVLQPRLGGGAEQGLLVSRGRVEVEHRVAAEPLAVDARAGRCGRREHEDGDDGEDEERGAWHRPVCPVRACSRPGTLGMVGLIPPGTTNGLTNDEGPAGG